MKYFLTLFTLCFFQLTFAQSELKITNKKCIPRKGFHLKLTDVSNDSRCPENVDCIWAGEVSVAVEVYENKKLKEEKTVVLNSKNRIENIEWFQNYYSKKIKSLGLLPSKKQGETTELKKQFIKVIFEE